ncbi:TPA: hypothetical protein ACGXQD_005350 [Bacillus cereus]|uniref:hypothetical protein n=1 Tax=Bacillus thuringiensis TaxID=1428 RepID=UPI003457FEF1|nr:hypothetical protein [Bacillus cereus]MDA1769560.1 hypothetical protein [Bacillus cereus]
MIAEHVIFEIKLRSDFVHNNNQLEFPSFFFNSIPKSGTHLVKQLLLGIPNIQNDELRGLYGELAYNPDAVEWLTNLKKNEFLNGHIF